MALSDYEKQVLAEMEAQLKQADPSLASVMTGSLPSTKPEEPAGRLSPRRVALGAILAIIGLVVVIAGVSTGFGIWAVVLGVVGFFLMVGGIMLALRPDRTKPSMKRTQTPKNSDGSFMSRQQEKWDGRRQQR